MDASRGTQLYSHVAQQDINADRGAQLLDIDVQDEVAIEMHDGERFAAHLPGTHSQYPSANDSTRLIGPGSRTLSAIDQEIFSVDALIQSLQRLRIVKSKARNIQALISRLPPEILAQIFLACIDSNHSPHQSDPGSSKLDVRLALGHVCTTWRSVAWNLPMLWTTLYCSVPSPDGSSRVADLLSQWLLRSQKLSVSIKVDFRDEGSWNMPLGIRAPLDVLEALLAFSDQWESLDLVLPESWLRHLNAFDSSRYVSLKEITIRPLLSAGHGEDEDIDVEGFLSPPELHTVTAWFFPFLRLHLPWANLVRGAFGGSSLDDIVQLLLQCPHLVEFHIYSPAADAHIHPITSITHGCLRILQIDLTLTATPQLVASDILDLMTCPGLKHISLRLPSKYPNPLRDVLELILRSACSLKDVEVIGPEIGEEEVVEFLSSSPVVHLQNA